MESETQTFINEVLSYETGVEFIPAFMAYYTRAAKSGAVRKLKNRGFITSKKDSPANVQVWIRTDKNSSEWDEKAPYRPRGSRGPNRRRFHNLARNGNLEVFVNEDWHTAKYVPNGATITADFDPTRIYEDDFTACTGCVEQVSDTNEYNLVIGTDPLLVVRIREKVTVTQTNSEPQMAEVS